MCTPAAPAPLCFAALWSEHGRSQRAAQRRAGLAPMLPVLYLMQVLAAKPTGSKSR